MSFLLQKDLGPDEFVDVVKKTSFPAGALMMAFSPAEARFEEFRFDEAFLKETEHGRIFSPDGELKWRRIGSLARTVYLGDRNPPEGLDDFSRMLEGMSKNTGEIVLWGVRNDKDGEWIEQKVPHRFAYPSSGERHPRSRAAVVVETWSSLNGANAFSRYHSLKEKPFAVETPGIPVFLKHLSIQNFLCIKETAIDGIDGYTPWVFLLGENGSGKTAILQAMAIGICGVKNAMNLLENQKEAVIYVEFEEYGNVRENKLRWRKSYRAWEFIERPGFFCAYGPSRLDIKGAKTVDEEAEYMDPEKSLLDQKGALLNIEPWLSNLEKTKNASTTAREARSVAGARFDATMDLFKRLLPNISEVRMEEDYLLFNECGYWSKITEIASGPRCVLAMVGDILIRLFEMQPGETDPPNLEGIVVIDEIDVHIHPRYQREFPKLLSEAFPRVQFICSTHSPLPLLGSPKGSRFFVVERNEETGTTVRDPGVDISRLHPNAILTSPLFDMQALFSDNLKGYEQLDPEDSYKEIEERRKLDERIERYSERADLIPKDWFEE